MHLTMAGKTCFPIIINTCPGILMADSKSLRHLDSAVTRTWGFQSRGCHTPPARLVMGLGKG